MTNLEPLLPTPCPETPIRREIKLEGVVTDFVFQDNIASFKVGGYQMLWITETVPDWLSDGAMVGIDSSRNIMERMFAQPQASVEVALFQP